MTKIRASCTDCGGVELTTAEVRVRVCAADDRGAYRFRCPRCHMTVVKPARRHTIDLLLAAGVGCERWAPPRELLEPRGGGAPIDHDELIEFHVALADDHRIWQELAGSSLP